MNENGHYMKMNNFFLKLTLREILGKTLRTS